MKDKTLKEIGASLPIGIEDASKRLHRNFEIKRWTGRTMRDLGKLRDESKELSMSEHVALVLSVLVNKLGPFDFSAMSRKEQKLVISNMFVGDVFYLYCWSRVQSLGEQLLMEITCPLCRNQFGYEADLGTLLVSFAESIEETFWNYELLDPVTLRGKEVKNLSMGSARWHHVENAQIEGSFDLEGGKLAVVAGSIRGIQGHEQHPLTNMEIDELSGRDIERIISLLDQHHKGPNMKVEVDCPNKVCKTRIARAIDWSYHSFFGASSRFRPSGNSSTESSI